jgi:hypothetical protein
LVVGIVEAAAAGGVGWWLYHALPRSDRAWSWVLFAAGFVGLVLSILLSGSAADATVEAPQRVTERASHPPEPKGEAEDPVALVPRLAADGDVYPAAVSDWWHGMLTTHFDVGARSWEVRQAAAAHAVLDGAGPADARDLMEAALVAAGYRDWARGEPPRFNLDPYRPLIDGEAARRRQRELEQEASDLGREWERWQREAVSGPDPETRFREAERRQDRLASLMRRAEELYLLGRAYRELLADSEDRPHAGDAEGDRRAAGEEVE